MEKFIPYEKLSKKEKRKLDATRRTTWGSFDPVTRKPKNSKAYNRTKARNWKREEHASSGNFCELFSENFRSLILRNVCRYYGLDEETMKSPPAQPQYLSTSADCHVTHAIP